MAKNKITQFVYVIKSTTGMVKVGISLDPEPRLRSLITGNPHGLTLEYTERFPYNMAAPIEKMVHGLLSEHRENGEWFRVDVSKAVSTIKLSAVAVKKLEDDIRVQILNELRNRRLNNMKTVYVDRDVYVDRTVYIDKIIKADKPNNRFLIAYASLLIGFCMAVGFFGLGAIGFYCSVEGINLYKHLLSNPDQWVFPVLPICGILLWIGLCAGAWDDAACNHHLKQMFGFANSPPKE
jgi:hypothetical protein